MKKGMPQALTCPMGRKCNSAGVGHARKKRQWMLIAHHSGVYLKGIHSASHTSSPEKERDFLYSNI